MTTTLRFDFPVWFKATPLKHRTPKIVRGIFDEQFDFPDTDPSDVHAVATIRKGRNLWELAEIDGTLFRSLGDVGSEENLNRFKAANSPIPGVRSKLAELGNKAPQASKDTGIALYPKRPSETGLNYPHLSRDMYSAEDLVWIDRRREKALEYLATMHVCNGVLYEPVPEPVYTVTLSVGANGPSDVLIDFRASNSRPFLLGYPVAYFRVDDRNEVVAYAEELALRLGIPIRHYGETPEIEFHDADRLRFDPYRHQLLEAASLVMTNNRTGGDGGKVLADLISVVIGQDEHEWRVGTPDAFGEAALASLEGLVRQSIEEGTTGAPAILVTTLMERWDERPIPVSASMADRLRFSAFPHPSA